MKTALAIAPAALLLLTGCAGNDSGSASPSADSGALAGVTAAPGPATGTSGSEPSTPGTGTPGSTTSTTSEASPTALPTTFTAIDQTQADPDLKESVTVTRIARALPWPAGYKASAQAYELVAVEMTWTPSTAFTIPIRKQDFRITTGSQFPSQPEAIVNETLKGNGWAQLPDELATGSPVTGWMVFKVDPRNAPSMVLDYNRPAAQVSGGGSSFPAKTFNFRLAG
jgi:hypothetical protein